MKKSHLFVLLLVLLLPNAARAQKQPNIVLFLFDDLDYLDLQLYNPDSEILTPNIDMLAADGMLFTEYHQNGATCTPTRTALMTGLYQNRFGMKGVCNDLTDPNGIPQEVTTLAETVQKDGYVAGHFGKWHLGTDRPEHFPNGQGFIESRVRRGGYINPLISTNGGPFTVTQGHLTELIRDYALEFIDRFAGQPFFLNVWFYSPHVPLEPLPRWAAQYPDTDRGKFAALMSGADEALGVIVDDLKTRGLYDDTFFIVMSDNGGHPDTHPTSEFLRGSKGNFYERGIKSPLIATWKNSIAAGTTNETFMRSVDWKPTFADLLNVEQTTTDGKSKLAAFTQGVVIPETERMFWETNLSVSRHEAPSGWFNQFAVRDDAWKLVMADNDTQLKPQLFNLSTDPAETTDVSDSEAAVYSDLYNSYITWYKSVSQISWEFEEGFGNFDFSGGVFRFNTPSIVFLKRNDLFDIGERELTLQFTFNASNPADRPELIDYNHSWRFNIGASQQLKFVVFDPDTQLISQTLTGTTTIQPDTDYDVAVTVKGFLQDSSFVQLYLDGNLEAEGWLVAHFVNGDSRIAIGNNKTLERPLIGTIKNLRAYQSYLRQEDL